MRRVAAVARWQQRNNRIRLCVAVLSVSMLSSPLIACQRATTTTAAILQSQALAQYPEYRLYYPGATVLDHGGRDAVTGPTGYSGASAGVTLGTGAEMADVLAFYARELAARGWVVSDIDGVPKTSELDARGWRKGPVAFRLGLLRPNDPRNPITIAPYRTAYNFALLADDPRDPSWQTQP